MDTSEYAPKVPIAAHLAEFSVPKEIVDDIIKSGWTCALVWGSALKDEQLADLFLRPGTTYGPAERDGSPEEPLRPASDQYFGTLSLPSRSLSIPTPVGMLGPS